MKVSVDWLKELVDLNISVAELVTLLPLRTIGIKDVTEAFLELDMKGYNRADLLSMRGIAYEVSAITDSQVLFNEPEEAKFAWKEANLPQLQVNIANPDLSPLYCLARIEQVKVEPSNPIWVKKLTDSGMRAVNNIADVTNLVMLEYGQPLHAFDAGKVRGTVRVRTAKKDEEIKTIDDKNRKLTDTNLVIADDNGPIALAGVMGGKETEISDSTTTILLEAAIFDPINIRKTTTQLNLPSEASKRFQHGLTKKRSLQALNAAIKMYSDLGGKLTAISLTGNFEEELTTLNLSYEKVKALTGIEISPEQVEEYLTKLHFSVGPRQNPDNLQWEITIPYWRLDIKIQEDLIEEIARLYGYEKIPSQELQGKLPEKIDQSLFESISKIQADLVKAGLTEVQTYSFYSTKVLEALGFYHDDNLKHLVKIANPISAETAYLRMDVWPNLIEAVDRNIRQGFKDIAIFEIGKVYTPPPADGPEGLPKEEYRLAIALMNGTDNPIGELIEIMKKSLNDVILSETKDLPGWEDSSSDVDGTQNDNKSLFHPTRKAQIIKDGQPIGGLAEAHPRLLNKLGIEKRVAILEISIESINH